MAGLGNWIGQVVSVSGFALRTLPERKGSSAAAAVGIAGVVAVLVGVLSIAHGFARALETGGRDDAAIVLRSGSDTEMMSGLSREMTRIVSDAPGVRRSGEGPDASAELFVVINLPKRSTGTDANVPLRGVEPGAFRVRENVQVVAGRPFEWGSNEVMVGVGAADQFAGLDLGGSLKVGANEWKVVGIFSADGGLPESEIWTDAAVLQPAYRRGDSFQSVHARLTSADAFTEFKDALTADPRLDVKVERQSDFYSRQSRAITGLITGLGILVAVLMGVGAVFGALNTMYSAVASRTREIATLRALGFGRSPVVLSVLFEALVLATLGGMVGGVLAYLVFDGYRSATINWQTFSQVAFAFDVSPGILVGALVYALVIGAVGGLVPAIRAAFMPVATALREG